MSATISLAITPTAGACCAPLARSAVDLDTARDLALRFKALADPARVQLLSIVAAHAGAEACVCDLTEPVGLSQPTVSHHLKILVDAGLLRREKRGRWSYYSLVPGALSDLGAALDETAAPS
ncbi:metalloregulator ArsR/SmtB family transcription factor [Mumia sp. Pv 4-285]|uniref:metalloregulator ArsR/SmtB family transcription factor n=1 Tax=Mumia qirimensis TaxID=3234852 RepID=UPI00351D02D3